MDGGFQSNCYFFGNGATEREFCVLSTVLREWRPARCTVGSGCSTFWSCEEVMAWTTGRSVALGGLHRGSLVSRRTGDQRRRNHGSGNSQTAAPAFFSARTARGPRGGGWMDGTRHGTATGTSAAGGDPRVECMLRTACGGARRQCGHYSERHGTTS